MLDENTRRSGARARRQRREPSLEGRALTPADREAEAIAIALWAEGRKDDAIAFLEREIMLEKDTLWKRDAETTRQEPHFDAPKDAAPGEAPKKRTVPEIVLISAPPKVTAIASAPKAEPDADKAAKGNAAAKSSAKRRKRGGRGRDAIVVSEPAFSDASAPQIELTADHVVVTPTIVPDVPDVPEREPFVARFDGGRIGRGPALVAAIGLAIIGVATAANIWDNSRYATPVVTHPAADEPATKDSAVTADGAATAPEETVASAPKTSEPAPATNAAASDGPETAVKAASAEELAAGEPAQAETVSEQSAAADAPSTAEPAVPATRGGALAASHGSADSVDESPAEAAGLASLSGPEPADAEPATLALVDPAAALPPEADDMATPPDELDLLDEAPPPVVDARLPRQRPEPPPAVTAAPARTASTTPDAQLGAPPRPLGELVYSTNPPPAPAEASPPATFYGPDGEPVAETLTPEEYQRLLRRRALAEDFVARRQERLQGRPFFQLLRRSPVAE